jgi:hypothetical protein
MKATVKIAKPKVSGKKKGNKAPAKSIPAAMQE